jgi:hypothetical protein
VFVNGDPIISAASAVIKYMKKSVSYVSCGFGCGEFLLGCL